MVVEEFISFKQSKCLENYMNFNTQKENRIKNDFEKDFFILLNAAFSKFLEKVRNRFEKEIIKKHEYKKTFKQQSKQVFNGYHKSYENCDGYTFKKN